jgi:segregation and condensation protein A
MTPARAPVEVGAAVLEAGEPPPGAAEDPAGDRAGDVEADPAPRDASAGAGRAEGADAARTSSSARGGRSEAFIVELENFSGPFDLLLSLIAKHKMDVTEVALSQVTDEFVAHIRRLGNRFDLGQATEFLVIAATLLDLKATRLLPGADSDAESEDLALLEARDLLFARLLQYKAYKEAAAIFATMMVLESRYTPRAVALEERYAAALPEVQISIGPSELAVLAAGLREPPLPPLVATDHVHAPRVNVREHMLAVLQRLRELGAASFRTLCAGCQETIEVVARFLALLELFREGRISFEQDTPLGELIVRWTDPDPGPEAARDRAPGGLAAVTPLPGHGPPPSPAAPDAAARGEAAGEAGQGAPGDSDEDDVADDLAEDADPEDRNG